MFYFLRDRAGQGVENAVVLKYLKINKMISSRKMTAEKTRNFSINAIYSQWCKYNMYNI